MEIKKIDLDDDSKGQIADILDKVMGTIEEEMKCQCPICQGLPFWAESVHVTDFMPIVELSLHWDRGYAFFRLVFFGMGFQVWARIFSRASS